MSRRRLLLILLDGDDLTVDGDDNDDDDEVELTVFVRYNFPKLIICFKSQIQVLGENNVYSGWRVGEQG